MHTCQAWFYQKGNGWVWQKYGPVQTFIIYGAVNQGRFIIRQLITAMSELTNHSTVTAVSFPLYCRLWTLCHTIQHRAVLIMFPLTLQTITITRMLSRGGEGVTSANPNWLGQNFIGDIGSCGTLPANFWRPLLNARKMVSKKTHFGKFFVSKTTHHFTHLPGGDYHEIWMNIKRESVRSRKFLEQNFKISLKRGHFP